jgi:cellulose synthase (UDP-forming)
VNRKAGASFPLINNTYRVLNTALLFLLMAPLAIIFYASYIFNPNNAGYMPIYILQVTADAIAMILVSGLWITLLLDIIRPRAHKRQLLYDPASPQQELLHVAVLIPVYREPLEVIEHTLTCAVQMEYPHETYVLDDGSSPAVAELARRLNVRYLSRPLAGRQYAKSGNLNFGLSQTDEDFFAVFDADHAPYATFLTELLPFFENPNVALVQTPQHYSNTERFIPAGTAQAQAIFYRYVQPAKNGSNAAFCVGTNMIYRRSAIDAVGGIFPSDHSEDIWTTLRIHQLGLDSVFYDKVLAEGRAPETVDAFFAQQHRWALGGFSMLFHGNPLFARGLTSDQRLQYLFSNILYFSGIATLIYLSLPLIYLMSGWYPIADGRQGIWLVHYVPYFAVVYFLPFLLLGTVKVSTVSVSMSSFYPYLRALGSALLTRRYRWVSTESRRAKMPIMVQIWPHVLFIMLTFTALLVGWYEPTDISTTLFASFWAVFNMYLLFRFVHRAAWET